MGDQADKTEKRRVCAGLLAHVDAGKTTLSEGMLYLAGQIRKPGRVDHGDAFLDTFELERERGITIFSKQALLPLGDLQVTLLDTPGHVDFSAEMERALQVMDYAILVISGTDGVQGHTRTLWRLLERYHIPTFLFINKMDQPGLLREELLEELKRKLGENCLDFGVDRTSPDFKENIAMCEESLLEEFLETGEIQERDVQRLIRERKLFPCYFGS
ncbi:MAG: GTP-binding protein, partial [Clostridiales bacterium]|nr:GTP-binding protein [Clostridiales bacterium]